MMLPTKIFLQKNVFHKNGVEVWVFDGTDLFLSVNRSEQKVHMKPSIADPAMFFADTHPTG
jgi:hypothetical protein